MSKSVLQEWVKELTFMQQSVLITATRGPDGIQKDHISKMLLRWLRRCYLYSAFEKCVLSDPYDPRGGSFTGPCRLQLDEAVDVYLRSVDEIPHHFQLHLMHAAEIMGYKHPDSVIRYFWNNFYLRIVKDAHLNPETKEQMDRRLSDNESTWREAEEVVAK